MDFNDSPEEAAYREKARAWLETNAADHKNNSSANGRRPNSPEHMALAKAWQAKKADAGYACITWPKEWGGAGGTPLQSVIFGQEESKVGVNYGYFTIGLGMCVPTVMAFADAETKTRFVKPAMRGEEIWCQLFSEPAGGSDVAAARTKAVRDGDDWVINGQKVWTTGAQYCDYGIVLVRTDPDVPKHKGLTMFWLDMKSPGIEVKPIPQVGFAEFDTRQPWTFGHGWLKLTSFAKPLYDLDGRTLFLDLDIVIVDSIDCFFDQTGEFCVIREWDKKDGTGNTSVYLYTIGAHADVLEIGRAHV